jgi:hypothetical protein
MNERICLTRSNWQEEGKGRERREFEDNVRGTLLQCYWYMKSVALGGCWWLQVEATPGV